MLALIDFEKQAGRRQTREMKEELEDHAIHAKYAERIKARNATPRHIFVMSCCLDSSPIINQSHLLLMLASSLSSLPPFLPRRPLVFLDDFGSTHPSYQLDLFLDPTISSHSGLHSSG
jgi:hypothetical protein